MAGPVLHAEGAEGPGQRVAALVIVGVDIDIERLEARPFREEIPPADAVAHAGVTPLQEGHSGGDGGQITVELLREGLDPRRTPRFGQCLDTGMDGAQPIR